MHIKENIRPEKSKSKDLKRGMEGVSGKLSPASGDFIRLNNISLHSFIYSLIPGLCEIRHR